MDSIRTVDKTLLVVPKMNNPWPVYANGEVIGSATVTLVENGMKVELFLRPDRPEVFDLDVAPEKVRLHVEGSFDMEGYTGYVELR